MAGDEQKKMNGKKLKVFTSKIKTESGNPDPV